MGELSFRVIIVIDTLKSKKNVFRFQEAENNANVLSCINFTVEIFGSNKFFVMNIWTPNIVAKYAISQMYVEPNHTNPFGEHR